MPMQTTQHNKTRGRFTKTYDYERYTLILDPDTKQALQQQAQSQNLPMSKMMRRLIWEGWNRWQEETTNTNTDPKEQGA